MLVVISFIALVGILTGVNSQGISCNGCYAPETGHCYYHGDTWKTNDCSTRRCRQTRNSFMTEIIARECKDAYGRCVRHGDELTVNIGGQAVQCRCSVGSTDRWEYVQCKYHGTDTGVGGCRGCSIDGVCRRFGERFEKDCSTYECRPTGSSWVADVVKTVCKDAYGVCRPHGSTISYVQAGQLHHDCTCSAHGTGARIQCGGSGRPSGRCEGCTVNGVCHDINTQWTHDCITYQCKKVGFMWVMAEPVKAQCKDAYGHCRNNNEVMSGVYGGHIFNNCVCSTNGLQTSMHCSGK